MPLFFLSLLPQFATPGSAGFVVMLLLGLAFCTMTFAWLAGYTLLVTRASDVLRRPTIRRILDVVLGSTLLAFGLLLVVEIH